VGCRNTVFGAEAQEASAHLDAWRSAGIRHFRLEFTHESGMQVKEVARLFDLALKKAAGGGAALGRALKTIAPGGTTQGSLLIPTHDHVLPVLQ
jgi:putative protease